MGYTKKQCRDQKKDHFARKIHLKKKPKPNQQENQNSLPDGVKEPAGPAPLEQ